MTKNSLTLFLLLSFTLGLAPFFPEPHLYGKLKWVFGGGDGMQARDYFDLLLHGVPWIGLLIVLGGKVIRRLK